MAKVVLKVSKPKSGDPVPGATIEEKAIVAPRDQANRQFDLGDRLAELVGKGNALKPDDKAAIYGSLVNLLGKDKAAKVMNHAYIFNTRPDVQKLSLDDKLRAFYAIGSNDPDVSEVIKSTKNLGYGPVASFNNSTSFINQQLTGRTPIVETAQTAPSEVQKKVMLRISK